MAADPVALTQELKRRAESEGFTRVGIAEAGVLGRDREALAAWLAAGREASMRWMAREPGRRADPRALLPGCRSVVTTLTNYGPGDDAGRPAGDGAPVAAYARGRDYHKVLGKKLRSLAAWLAEASGLPARAFVDTGPVLERAWAERAGLGWIGKNANLLTRDLGSWLLLGEVLSAAPLVPDAGPHAEFCGSCTACIDACPTGAIVADGLVDSNLCIAYWTIEHRGPVPEPLREPIGERIFGCDVCQEVCPWNRSFARPADPRLLDAREDLGRLDPLEVLGMDEATYRRRFSGTALMRARWDGMRRNACIVLGNRRSAAALPALGAALDDPDPMLRSHAAWAIGRIGGADAAARLHAAAAREDDGAVLRAVRRAAARALRSGPEPLHCPP